MDAVKMFKNQIEKQNIIIVSIDPVNVVWINPANKREIAQRTGRFIRTVLGKDAASSEAELQNIIREIVQSYMVEQYTLEIGTQEKNYLEYYSAKSGSCMVDAAAAVAHFYSRVTGFSMAALRDAKNIIVARCDLWSHGGNIVIDRRYGTCENTEKVLVQMLLDKYPSGIVREGSCHESYSFRHDGDAAIVETMEFHVDGIPMMFPYMDTMGCFTPNRDGERNGKLRIGNGLKSVEMLWCPNCNCPHCGSIVPHVFMEEFGCPACGTDVFQYLVETRILQHSVNRGSFVYANTRGIWIQDHQDEHVRYFAYDAAADLLMGEHVSNSMSTDHWRQFMETLWAAASVNEYSDNKDIVADIWQQMFSDIKVQMRRDGKSIPAVDYRNPRQYAAAMLGDDAKYLLDEELQIIVCRSIHSSTLRKAFSDPANGLIDDNNPIVYLDEDAIVFLDGTRKDLQSMLTGLVGRDMSQIIWLHHKQMYLNYLSALFFKDNGDNTDEHRWEITVRHLNSRLWDQLYQDGYTIAAANDRACTLRRVLANGQFDPASDVEVVLDDIIKKYLANFITTIGDRVIDGVKNEIISYMTSY